MSNKKILVEKYTKILNFLLFEEDNISVEEKEEEKEEEKKNKQEQKTTDNKSITPREFSQRLLSNTPRKSGEVDPEFKAEWESAYEKQVGEHGKLSPETKKYLELLTGDPSKKQYTDTEIEFSKTDIKDPGTFGYYRPGYGTVSPKIVVDPNEFGDWNPKASDKTKKDFQNYLLAHEITHAQQYAAGDTKNISTDREKPYKDRTIEGGADWKGKLMQYRSKLPEAERLKPLTDEDIDTIFNDVLEDPEFDYSGYINAPSNIRRELKDYWRHTIVRGDKKSNNNLSDMETA